MTGLEWRKAEFLEWLCTIEREREPRTLKEFAERISVTTQTLNKWKADPDFLAEWEKLYLKTVGNPGKRKEVVDTLHETAVDRTDPRHVQAARTYLEAVDAIKPQKVDVTVNTKGAQELSDDQLYEILAARAAVEMERREADRA